MNELEIRQYLDPSKLSNPELPPYCLKLLYYQTKIPISLEIRQTILANPNTPTEVLKNQFQDSLGTILSYIYDTAEVTGSTTEHASEFSCKLLKAIFENPVLPLLILENPNLVEDWFSYDVESNIWNVWYRHFLIFAAKGIKHHPERYKPIRFVQTLKTHNLETLLNWIKRI